MVTPWLDPQDSDYRRCHQAARYLFLCNYKHQRVARPSLFGVSQMKIEYLLVPSSGWMLTWRTMLRLAFLRPMKVKKLCQ